MNAFDESVTKRSVQDIFGEKRFYGAIPKCNKDPVVDEHLVRKRYLDDVVNYFENLISGLKEQHNWWLYSAPPSTTLIQYAPVKGTRLHDGTSSILPRWRLSSSDVLNVIPAPIAIKGARIRLLNQPGPGASYTFVLLDDLAPTPVSVTISAGQLGGEWMGTYVVDEASSLLWRCTPSGGPAGAGYVTTFICWEEEDAAPIGPFLDRTIWLSPKILLNVPVLNAWNVINLAPYVSPTATEAIITIKRSTMPALADIGYRTYLDPEDLPNRSPQTGFYIKQALVELSPEKRIELWTGSDTVEFYLAGFNQTQV